MSSAGKDGAAPGGETPPPTTPKHEWVLIHRRRRVGVISPQEARQMQVACGYGGPHIRPDR